MTRAEALRQAAREQAEKLADLERREVKAQRDGAGKPGGPESCWGAWVWGLDLPLRTREA